MYRSSDRPGNEARNASGELLLELTLRHGRKRKTLRDALLAAIQDGRLTARTVLPASRRLATDLGVSRGVVTDVYDQLVSEGYLEVTPRSAPAVAQIRAAPAPPSEPPAPVWRFDLGATTPDVALFPRRAWLRSVERAMRAAPDSALDYSDHRGRIELRTALAMYLARSRAVRIDPGRIVVTQGFTQALDMLAHVLVASGRPRIAMESPSHPGLWSTVRQSGATLVACPVDEEGMRVERLGPLRADAAVVAPAHQFPTGAVMSRARRIALAEWASSPRRLVIEDDYDAEFRYDRTPNGAVQGLAPGRVAHIGTASKTLAPGVRLGWISSPPDLVPELQARKSATDSGSPAVDQLALAHLIGSGEYERQIVRARHVYRRRRDLLVAAISKELPGLGIQGAAAGMQLLLRLPDAVDDVQVAQAAALRGINVPALSPLNLEPSSRRGLLIGFGRLLEAQIDSAVAALAPAIREALAPA